MEQETKIPEGNTLISVAIPVAWVKQKKFLAVPWRRIISEGITQLSNIKTQENIKNEEIRRILERELQEANRKIDEYQQILSVRR